MKSSPSQSSLTPLIAILMLCLCNPLLLADIVFEATSINITAISGKPSPIAKFTFINKGPETIQIKSIQPDCGCTSAFTSHSTLAIGESGEIEASVSSNLLIGFHEKVIRVFTEPGQSKPIVLTLLVEIKEPVKLSRKTLIWAVDSTKEPLHVEVSSGVAARITEITPISPRSSHIYTKVNPMRDAGHYRITLMPQEGATSDTIAIDFIAHYDDGSSASFRVYALFR